jgi:ATP synthase F0 subunit b
VNNPASYRVPDVASGGTESAGLYDIHFEWSTFIGQLVGFAVIVFVIVRYVVPPLRAMMNRQQDAVRTQLEESRRAEQRLTEARRAAAAAVEDARREAAEIREDAHADARDITEQLAAQADAEVARVSQRGREQAELARRQLIRQLEGDLGAAALAQAERQVREHLASDQAKADSVDRFLDRLESMAGVARTRES